MRILRGTIILVVFFLGLGLAVINAGPVELHYYFGSATLPFALVLVLGLAVGVALGWLAALARVLRLKQENSRLRRSARVAEQEVANLRAIPIRNDK